MWLRWPPAYLAFPALKSPVPRAVWPGSSSLAWSVPPAFRPPSPSAPARPAPGLRRLRVAAARGAAPPRRRVSYRRVPGRIEPRRRGSLARPAGHAAPWALAALRPLRPSARRPSAPPVRPPPGLRLARLSGAVGCLVAVQGRGPGEQEPPRTIARGGSAPIIRQRAPAVKGQARLTAARLRPRP